MVRPARASGSSTCAESRRLVARARSRRDGRAVRRRAEPNPARPSRDLPVGTSGQLPPQRTAGRQKPCSKGIEHRRVSVAELPALAAFRALQDGREGRGPLVAEIPALDQGSDAGVRAGEARVDVLAVGPTRSSPCRSRSSSPVASASTRSPARSIVPTTAPQRPAGRGDRGRRRRGLPRGRPAARRRGLQVVVRRLQSPGRRRLRSGARWRRPRAARRRGRGPTGQCEAEVSGPLIRRLAAP